jgi:hypothetical protein
MKASWNFIIADSIPTLVRPKAYGQARYADRCMHQGIRATIRKLYACSVLGRYGLQRALVRFDHLRCDPRSLTAMDWRSVRGHGGLYPGGRPTGLTASTFNPSRCKLRVMKARQPNSARRAGCSRMPVFVVMVGSIPCCDFSFPTRINGHDVSRSSIQKYFKVRVVLVDPRKRLATKFGDAQ